MIGHTMDRCFELVGYPPGYKKKNVIVNKDKSVSCNAVVSKKTSTSNKSAFSLPFTNEQISKLVSLLNENSVSSMV